MSDIYTLLDDIGVAYERFDHAAVFTCDEADAAVPNSEAVQTKNIFLRDKRGRRHFLLITSCDKSVDIKRFADDIDADHLSFASADRMLKYLGVTPGSVTVFGLMNDTSLGVEVFVDRDVWNASAWRCHPLVNTATLVVGRDGIDAFLARTGHTPRIVTIENRVPSNSH